jgi:hypothetical protein
MSKGETGVETLIDAGLVEPVDHLPECSTWEDVIGVLAELASSEHTYKTLVIDTLNGLEQLASDGVMGRDYSGSAKDFIDYSKGSKNVAAKDWRELLIALDRVREAKRMTIVGLAHTRVGNVKNPSGPDYDKHSPALSKDVLEITNRWADAILFMDFEVFFKDDSKVKAKASGGTTRVMYTQGAAAHTAKNRFGMTEPIDLGITPDDAWEAFSSAIKAAKSAGKDK